MEKAKILLLTFSLLFFFLLPTVTTAKVTYQELDSAISALRSNGYTLFPNAIATSDLGLRLLTSNTTTTFTLFAPPDPLLYSLDLSSMAPQYTTSLLRHVSPSRLSTSDLRRLSTVKTLSDPHHHPLRVERSRVGVLESVKLDGVRVLVPDLFLGKGIAVHGLEGILVDRFGSDHGFQDWVSPASSPESLAPEPMMGNGIDRDELGHGKFSKFSHWFTL